MIKVNRKIFTILYRLTLPGSLLLFFSALLIRVGVLADPQTPLVKFLPVVVFGIGLAGERILPAQPAVLCTAGAGPGAKRFCLGDAALVNGFRQDCCECNCHSAAAEPAGAGVSA